MELGEERPALDAAQAHSDLMQVVEERCGEGCVSLDKRGRPIGVPSERWIGWTRLFSEHLTAEASYGAAAYGELSVSTHPTGGNRALESWWVTAVEKPPSL